MIITHDYDGCILGKLNDPVSAINRAEIVASGLPFIELVPDEVMHIYVDPEGVSHEIWNPGHTMPSDPDKHYIADGKLATRPAFKFQDKVRLIVDGENSFTFELPAGATVTLGDKTHEIADGVLVITSTMPDAYELRFSAFPYLDKTVKVTTHAA